MQCGGNVCYTINSVGRDVLTSQYALITFGSGNTNQRIKDYLAETTTTGQIAIHKRALAIAGAGRYVPLGEFEWPRGSALWQCPTEKE